MKRREVALVTGGARGIGRAIAERLAADGFETLIGDLDLQAAEEVAATLTARGLAGRARSHGRARSGGRCVGRLPLTRKWSRSSSTTRAWPSSSTSQT